MLIVQVAPGTRTPVQVVVKGKSLLVESVGGASVPGPLLVRVTVWVALLVPRLCPANDRLVVERAATGLVPLPERPMACAPLGSLLTMFSAPARGPVAVGVKIMLILQCAPEGTEPPQVFVTAKSPVGCMLVIESDAEPMLVKTTVCGVLGTPMLWSGNARLVALRLISGATEIARVTEDEPHLVTSMVLQAITKSCCWLVIAVGGV